MTKVQMQKNRMEILLLCGDKTCFIKYKHTHFSKEMAERFEGILGLSYSLRSLLGGTFKCLFFTLKAAGKQFKRKELCGWPVKRRAMGAAAFAFYFLPYHQLLG